MRNVLCKVYAAFFPVREIRLETVKTAAMSSAGSEDWLFLEGDMLRISFEGAYFPLEEMLVALLAVLPPSAEGKLDYLDIERWKLLRHVFRNGGFDVSERDLNQVLDYSGH